MPAECRRCGSKLAADSVEGHCPSCLVHFAFETRSAEQGEDELFHQSFGEYELLDEIGRGGIGVIYRARQRSLNRFVAVKMLIAGEFASPDFKRRLHQEAKAAASLQHPNIVAIHEIGERNGQPFFSMDLVEGANLGELVREQALPARRSAQYVKTIAEATAFAHAKGILHRDLKPSNILIDCFDQPRITDFGLAKQFLGTSDLTRTYQAFGSPAYMAPEQIVDSGGPNVGPRVDIYSLGALLYHLLTGRPPFQGETLPQILRQVQENEPVAPCLLNPAVPKDLETICLKCLQKEPVRRYSTASELGAELGRFLEGEPIYASPISSRERAWRWCRRKPVLASLITAVAVLILFLLAGSWLATWRIARARSAM
jgi:eukaryotic-like serine/threonine-protein kinase